VPPAGDFVHLVHPPQVMPADVTVDDVAVLMIFGPVDGICRPALEARAEFIAPGQNPALYEEAAIVFTGPRVGQSVEGFAGDVWRDGEVSEKGCDMLLLDLGQAPVGPFHRFQRSCQWYQFVGHGTGGLVWLASRSSTTSPRTQVQQRPPL
jgi:hypothetical protein